MKKSPWITILFLVLWTLILGVVYWTFAETEYTLFVSAVYAVCATVLFIFFLLVNGGLRSLYGEEKKRAALARETAKLDGKGKSPETEAPPRPDLFHLGAEKQEKAARILLMTAAPFFFILAADYIYLHFFFKG